MSAKKNPLKLNKLQLRTLVLAQVLAKTPGMAEIEPETGDATLLQLPHAHGDHVHIGGFTVSAREASGFSNPAVWVALARIPFLSKLRNTLPRKPFLRSSRPR